MTARHVCRAPSVEKKRGKEKRKEESRGREGEKKVYETPQNLETSTRRARERILFLFFFCSENKIENNGLVIKRG